MEKYKLIKEYPKSPKLGYEVWYSGLNSSRDWEGTVFYETHSEYWEKVLVEKNYEILSFIRNDGNAKNAIKTKVKGSKDIFEWYLTNYQDSEKRLLKSPGFDIHSVKRLSDGVVFTIGDLCKVKDSSTRDKIGSFFITEKGLHVRSLKFTRYLQDIEISKPLLTTEEGVDLFVGDKYWFVWVVSKGIPKGHQMNTPYEGTVIELDRDSDWSEDAKFFSTKELAQEYIVKDKKIFSLTEIIQILSLPLYNNHTNKKYVEKFKEIAFKKLN